MLDNAEYASMYSFDVVYVINTQKESGTILAQNPDPGRSMMVTPEGIKKLLAAFYLHDISDGKIVGRRDVNDIRSVPYETLDQRTHIVSIDK